MVAHATNSGRRGLFDFLVQRISAVILGLFALCVGGWFAVNPGAGHVELAAYLGTPVMMAFASLAIASLIGHTWVGMWTVGTDYLRPHYFAGAATVVRLAYQIVVGLVLLAYGAWAVSVIWRLA